MLDTYVAKMLIPTTQPGIECPADVKSSAELPFLKNEQPKTTTPNVKTIKMIKSISCMFSDLQFPVLDG